MSKDFIESVLTHKIIDGPYLWAHLKGYKRSWTFAWPTSNPYLDADGNSYKDSFLIDGKPICPKYLHYLNIKEEAGALMNGVLYLAPESDLPLYEKWELGYERFEVTALIHDFEIKGGPVFSYKALAEFEKELCNDPKQNLLERSYFEIIEDALEYWGKEFAAEFKNSTDPLDEAIIKENIKTHWLDPPFNNNI